MRWLRLLMVVLLAMLAWLQYHLWLDEGGRRSVAKLEAQVEQQARDNGGLQERNDALQAEVEDLKARYRAGKVGDVEVKEKLARALNGFLDPLRERRALYESQSGLADEVVFDGTIKMREEARKTLGVAKKAMGLSSVWNRISRKAEDVKKKTKGG